MRHGKKFNHLSRKKGHRKALLRNMAISLIEHKRIRTTLAKAKELRKFVEPLVTRARKAKSVDTIKDSSHNIRVVYSYLQNKEAVKTLCGEIVEKVGERKGGYLRILRTHFRQNDAAQMCIIEFVDFNELALETETKKKKRTRRSRRKKSNDTADAVATTEEVAAVEETTTDSEDSSDAADDQKANNEEE